MRQLDSLRMNTNDDVEVELEAAELSVIKTEAIIQEMKNENVIKAADYALEHLMTSDHIKLRNYSKMVAKRLLLRSLASSFQIWKRFSRWVYESQIMMRWLKSLYLRKSLLAFRHWDKVVNTKKPQSRTSKLKTGLVINLSNKKRQKYRKMVLESISK